MQEIKFRLSGSCQFFDTTNGLPTENQRSHFKGLWRWIFDNGTAGITHINGVTTIQIGSHEATISGIIRIDMAEIDQSSPDRQILFLSYQSMAFQMDDNNLKITIKGDFVGGVGQYTDAGGTLTLIAIKNIITEGSGHLTLI